MAPPSLPLTFASQFWSSDYRTGIEALYRQLDAGIVENQELSQIIKARGAAHRRSANDLAKVANTPLRKDGYDRDEGFTSRLGFNGLLRDTNEHATYNYSVAQMLEEIHSRFQGWCNSYEDRIENSKDYVMDRLVKYEAALRENNKLHEAYINRCQEADEAEEEARLSGLLTGSPVPKSPTTRSSTASTNNPNADLIATSDTNGNESRQQQRQESNPLVSITRSFTRRSNNVAQTVDRLRRIAREKEDAASGKEVHDTVSEESSEHETQQKKTQAPIVNKKGMIEIAGVHKTPTEWSSIFAHSRDNIPKRSVRVPIVGTYDDVISGQDLVFWFKDNLGDLENSIEKSLDFCKQITEEYDLLRLVGEIGNQFHAEPDSYYIWRAAAFDEFAQSVISFAPPRPSQTTDLDISTDDNKNKHTSTQNEQDVSSPSRSRSTSMADYITNAFQNVSMSQQKELKHEKTRRLAHDIEVKYRHNVKELDHRRLLLEQHIAKVFPYLQNWELERLRTVKAVMRDINRSFDNTTTKLHKSAQNAIEMEAAISPERDLHGMIEAHRTGPFKPSPHIWTDHYGEDYDVNFGIDLLRWFESPTGTSDVHPVFATLLNRLETGYDSLPDNESKRKSWLYDVPLDLTHKLRFSLNDSHTVAIDRDHTVSLLENVDLPVVASTAKLWLLELQPPLIPYVYQDSIKSILKEGKKRSNGSDKPDDQAIEELREVLLRLPRVCLMVLDAFVGHLSRLAESTKSQEEGKGKEREKEDQDTQDDFYIKLGLSLGRCIIRPQMENPLSLSDKMPSNLLTILVEEYDKIIPPTIAAKRQRESQRAIPQRKRTAPVDVRIRRSQLKQEKLPQPMPQPPAQPPQLENINSSKEHPPLPAEVIEQSNRDLPQEPVENTNIVASPLNEDDKQLEQTEKDVEIDTSSHVIPKEEPNTTSTDDETNVEKKENSKHNYELSDAPFDPSLLDSPEQARSSSPTGISPSGNGTRENDA